MTERAPPGVTRRALLMAGAAAPVAAGAAAPVAAAAPAAPASPFLLGLLTQADDERYLPAVLEKAYPDAPEGSPEPAVRLGLADSGFVLEAAGWSSAQVLAQQAPDAAGVGAALARLQARGVRHVVLALPAPGVVQAARAARGQPLLLFNAAAPEDSLRANDCAPSLLHTLPSHAMQMDALAQLLVARRWPRPLVLHGPEPRDRLLHAAWRRSARRFGVRPVAERAFKLSNDPREREQGNPRLLTADRDYDAIVVLDTVGEFARTLPYRSVQPRPVLGSSGLVAQAWSPRYERHGGPQLTRRFQRAAGRPMGSYDWAAWIGARAAAEAASLLPRASAQEQLKALRDGRVMLDGSKGQRLAFRAWDGQLRQPLLLAWGNGVAEVAPLDGFLHASNTLDTLGFDAPETGCRPA